MSALALMALAGTLLPAPASIAQDARPKDDSVEVSDYMTVDIFVQDEDLGNVLQMLSKQTKKNIVASKDISGSVTANFYNVTFEEALTNILAINGYGWVQEGNFIYVLTIDEIKQRQAEQRRIVSRVVQLSYLNAADAAAFVEPLLSDAGSIKASGDVPEFSISVGSPGTELEFAL